MRPANLNSRPVGQVRTQVDVEPQDLRHCDAERICGRRVCSYRGIQQSNNGRRRFRCFTPDSSSPCRVCPLPTKSQWLIIWNQTTLFPGHTSVSRPRKPERRTADRPVRPKLRRGADLSAISDFQEVF
ncbi:uncharacterized protein PEZ65_021565 [Lycodopsis pacificus]